MAIDCTPIGQYRQFVFTAGVRNGAVISHDVYRRGRGAQVVIIQELPGIGRETLRLADRFVERGFEVVLPHLFGPIGKTSIAGNLLRVFCMRREFDLFAANRSSPIVDWLGALCKKLRRDRQSSGVGVIGMCLTGNFAISLMADDSVLAAVASQPSMPIARPASLHMSEAELNAVKNRIDRLAPMMALRFEGDKICNAGKFAAIDRALNTDSSQRICLTTLPGNGHSVLTLDFVDRQGEPTHEALKQVIGYFQQQLQ
jgi:dienelactone hydrolase